MMPYQPTINLNLESVLSLTFKAALRQIHNSVDATEEFIYADRIGPIAEFLGWEHAALLRAQIESVSDAEPDVRLEFWDSFERWFKLTPNTRIAAMFASAAERFPEIDSEAEFDMLEALR